MRLMCAQPAKNKINRKSVSGAELRVMEKEMVGMRRAKWKGGDAGEEGGVEGWGCWGGEGRVEFMKDLRFLSEWYRNPEKGIEQRNDGIQFIL